MLGRLGLGDGTAVGRGPGQGSARPWAYLRRFGRQPRLVAEIRYAERTSAGKLRDSTYLGLRDDKSAADLRAAATASGTSSADLDRLVDALQEEGLVSRKIPPAESEKGPVPGNKPIADPATATAAVVVGLPLVAVPRATLLITRLVIAILPLHLATAAAEFSDVGDVRQVTQLVIRTLLAAFLGGVQRFGAGAAQWITMAPSVLLLGGMCIGFWIAGRRLRSAP